MPVDIFVTENLDFYKFWADPKNPRYKKHFIGTIDENKDLPELEKAAAELNLKCLGFVHIIPDVYFNYLQIEEIEHEIEQLKKHPKITHNTIESLETAVNYARGNKKLYLHFEGQ